MKDEIFAYVASQYGTDPEYLWPEYPEFAVMRHRGSNKWFAMVMVISGDKLGLDGDAPIEILNVKSSPDDIEFFKHVPGFFPAYHMNKKHWLTVALDGTVEKEKVFSFIDASYRLTGK